MNAPREPALAWRLALPLTCYLGVTLVAPALRGAVAREAYGQHAEVVLAVSGLCVCLFLAIASLAAARTGKPACARLAPAGTTSESLRPRPTSG